VCSSSVPRLVAFLIGSGLSYGVAALILYPGRAEHTPARPLSWAAGDPYGEAAA
jgi:hypothetical protein